MGFVNKSCKMVGKFADAGSAVADTVLVTAEGGKKVITNLLAAAVFKSDTVAKKALADNIKATAKVSNKLDELGVTVNEFDAEDFLLNGKIDIEYATKDDNK